MSHFKLVWPAFIFVASIVLSACESNPTTSSGGTSNVGSNQATDCLANSAPSAISVALMLGNAPGLGSYQASKVCDLLGQVNRHISESGVSSSYKVDRVTAVDPAFNRVNNMVMNQVVRSAPANQLTLVVSDAIVECGATVGYILGCTPRIGSPVVFVKRMGTFESTAPESIIWAHELGHAFGLGHPDNPRIPQLTNRLMTYMPAAQSKQLVPNEAQAFNSRVQRIVASQSLATDKVAATSTQAAGAAVSNVRNLDELQHLLKNPGMHGVDLSELQGVSQETLSRLSSLVREQAGGNSLRSTMIQVNALSIMGLLGGAQVQAVVRTLLTDPKLALSPEVSRYGVWALSKGQLTFPTKETMEFLSRAQNTAFWCPTGANALCEHQARSAIQGWGDFGLCKIPASRYLAQGEASSVAQCPTRSDQNTNG